MPANITIVEVSSQPIELCKLLKIANLVTGGGEAKIVISSGYVSVNQAVEYQKRKKIYDQDIIEFNGESIQVFCNLVAMTTEQTKQQKHFNQVKKNTSKTKQKNSTISEEQLQSTAPLMKRRPITF